MTREEAIAWFENWLLDYYDIDDIPRELTAELAGIALAALRQQDVPDKNVGKNDPLTLDELRQMDGEPVWVQSPGIPEYGRWAIVEGVGENCLFLHDDFTCHEYGKTWLAYRSKKEV